MLNKFIGEYSNSAVVFFCVCYFRDLMPHLRKWNHRHTLIYSLLQCLLCSMFEIPQIAELLMVFHSFLPEILRHAV